MLNTQTEKLALQRKIGSDMRDIWAMQPRFERRSGKTRKGNRYLRRTLIQAALGATRKNGSALQARYYRVKRHRGHKKAVVAVGHQILEIAYYVMHDGVSYDELGADYFDRRHAERAVRRHVRQLEALGFHVTIEKAA